MLYSGVSVESYCLSINKQGWVRIQNRRYGCGLKVEIKTSETGDNPNRLLFRCPTGNCRFFEWWKTKDDAIPTTGGSKLMGISHGGVRSNANRVFDDVPYPSFQSHGIDNELVLARHLFELEANNGTNKMLLHVVLITLLVILLLLIFKF